ncbi:uncharacterized protein yc1106_02433 [Curvularia clavata]|uniref:Uncharacterized protein n=1 Tax=Curvularia clavata TaxID=95742 RepID=A0A9Q9DQX7_CURCL|nr:uncharacterized protein yc1106_02433 [Curvularia clavata]
MFEPPTPQQDRATSSSAIRAKVSRFPTLWREGHRRAAKDFRARWRRCGLWCLVAMWLVGLIFALIALILADSELQYDLGACLPDGSFSLDPDSYRYFSGSGFFEITLAFGSMTFTQAKAIDVAWDIVVGRGGQSLLAYISWCVFANYVTTSMEVMPVTFRTYRTIFLQNGSLLVGIPRLIRDFCSRHALHSRFAMVFMVFTMAFSLAFPTLVSSLTGYKGNVGAFVKTAQGNYVPFSSFDYVSFVIHDGSRIDLGDDYIVGTGGLEQGKRGEPNSSPVEPTIRNGNLNDDKCFRYTYYTRHESCAFHLNVTEYVRKYGLNGENNVTSKFGDKELPPPVLNIWSPVLDTSTMTVQKGPSMQWLYEKTTYTEADLLQDGKCQPNLAYQWGFSFIQSFITILLLLIWSIGIYIMWLRSHSVMKRRGRTDIAGEHKAVLELAQAMQQQHAGLASPIKEQDEQEEKDGASTTTTAVAIPVTEASLRHRVTKELRGGSIAYTAPLLANGEIADDWTLWAWVKAHKWSIAGMVPSCFLPFLSGLFLSQSIAVFVALPIELAAALYIGSTRASRVVIFFWGFILCSIVPQIILSATST